MEFHRMIAMLTDAKLFEKVIKFHEQFQCRTMIQTMIEICAIRDVITECDVLLYNNVITECDALLYNDALSN